MFKLNAKFDTDLLLYLLSHFECDGHTVHMLTQGHLPPPLTSTVTLSLLHMHIPVHSPWLLGYIDVAQTNLVVLTMAGLFPDRPRASVFRHRVRSDSKLMTASNVKSYPFPSNLILFT